jgi:hypothetical protein
MRVKLVVTGDLERKALGTALERCFVATSTRSDIAFLPPRKVQGITTMPLPSDDDVVVPRNVDGLARAMIAEVWEGADGKPSDLVVAIDDLELANQTHPHRVTSWVRRGVQRELDRRSQDLGLKAAERLRTLVHERCSFHLLAPMIEAYFFADRSALQRAGAASDYLPQLARPDVEDFETVDPAFLPIARGENERRHALGYHWWRHERHPKHYLAHLCGQNGGIYQETSAGSRALAELRWASLPADATALAFARALFQDLADAFAVDNPMGMGELASATYPMRAKPRAELLLRNL